MMSRCTPDYSGESTTPRFVAGLLLLAALAGCPGSGGGSRSGLPAPGGVSAISDASGEITVDWILVPGAASFNLYWSNSPGVTKASGTRISGVTPPYSHTGLSNGTTYYYVVASLGAGGGVESVVSSEAFAQPIDAPSGLTATGASTAITLDWPPVPGATTYNLYWSTSPGVDKASGTLVSDVTAPHLHQGLTPGLTYYYVVTALNSVGGGAESSESPEASDSSGLLDPTLNGQGWVVHGDVAGPDATDSGFGITLDAAGRILVTGFSNDDAGIGVDGMVVWRCVEDGTLDTSFNGQGWVLFSGALNGFLDRGRDIVVDGLGRIVVTGTSDWYMALWRYNEDGTLDTTFNGQGWVLHDNAAGGNLRDEGFGVALDSGGRIVVAGDGSSMGSFDMAVWRYNDDGTLDTTFNGQGWVVHHDAAGGDGDDHGRDLGIDTSGRILVAGFSTGLGGLDMALWRFNPDGSFDTTFNGQGWVTHDGAAGGASTDLGLGLALDGLGRILVTGWSVGASTFQDAVVWRYDDDGTLDATFNGQGWVVHHDAAGGGGNDRGLAVALDAVGRVVVVGRSGQVLPDTDMVVWRYDDTGSLDPGFNGQGWFTHGEAAGFPSINDVGNAVTLDATGRILVAGSSGADPFPGYDMVIWRLRP
ncbi:MAG: hypothetical protein O7H41_13930 [Planctomycetota bacterium]|nr:hypothetical protein [Planctomycetota bacterium]